MTKGYKILSRPVNLRMSVSDFNRYSTHKLGLKFALYGYDFKNSTALIHFFGSTLNPDPVNNISKNDIDRELYLLDKNKKIEQDHIKKSPFPKKLQKPSDFFTKHIGLTSIPLLQGQYDPIRSRIRRKYKYNIPKMELKEINQYYEKNSKEYDIKKPKIEVEKEFKGKDGNKYCRVEAGEIIY